MRSTYRSSVIVWARFLINLCLIPCLAGAVRYVDAQARTAPVDPPRGPFACDHGGGKPPPT